MTPVEMHRRLELGIIGMSPVKIQPCLFYIYAYPVKVYNTGGYSPLIYMEVNTIQGPNYHDVVRGYPREPYSFRRCYL